MPFLQVELDGPTIFAEGPSGDVVTIKKFEKCNNNGVIEYLKKCSHENIVTTLEYKIVSSELYLFQESTMTYTLRQVITTPRAFTDKQIATVCREILKGIQFLHKQGIVHGNLTPQNVLLSGDGKVKIGNFSSCSRSNPPLDTDIEALALVCMEMMEPSVLELSIANNQDNPQLLNPKAWDNNIIDFITICERKGPLSRVASHAFLGLACEVSILIPNIIMAKFTVLSPVKLPTPLATVASLLA
ncbi:kinase-like domain-containing protein [Pyronema domesticum]|nr:kinase-like domain-containing protein [Pyronema domesticum]